MATWSKLFTNFAWKNRPDTSTPLGQTLLNRINEALNEIDNRVITLNSQKASTDEIQGVFTDVRLIKNTGQFVFTLFDGTEKIIDTALEKISINVSFDKETQMMVLEKEDGSKEYVDLSVFTTQYEFVSSPTIQQTVTDGKVRADIKPNSITDQMLQTNYLADITTQANTAVSASQSALESQSLAEQYAEDAEESAERAEAAADRAEAVAGFTIDTNLDANSSNPIANKAVVSGLNSIQSTSKATLSRNGWYRVAEYKADVPAYLKGIGSNSCELIIKLAAGNTTGEYHVLQLMSTLNSQTIRTVISKLYSTVNRGFTKCRYTYDGNKAYLEVYYNLSVGNLCYFEIMHPSDCNYQWKAVTPTITSEVVDGVTVTTTYDIPANASPVTDLNLFSNVESYANLDFDTLDTMKIYAASGIPSALGATNYPVDKTGLLVVEGKTVVSQKYITYDGAIYERSKLNLSGRTWSEWKQTATTADLAKYLPLTGGGEVTRADAIPIGVKNTASNTAYTRYSGKDGVLGFLGMGRENTPVYMDKDGNGKYLLHTGNMASYVLPLDVGSGNAAIKTSGNVPLNFTATINGGVLIGFRDSTGALGALGVSSKNNPVYSVDGTRYPLLHTGNITDYVAADSETGTFTLKESGVTLGTGTYYKVGKMVHCRATGNLQQAVSTGYHSLTGLPFANASQNASVVDFHTHQYYGKASDNIVFDVGASEITINVTSAISQNQPFTFSAIYFTE